MPVLHCLLGLTWSHFSYLGQQYYSFGTAVRATAYWFVHVFTLWAKLFFNYFISFGSKAAMFEINCSSQLLLKSSWFSPQWYNLIKKAISYFLRTGKKKKKRQATGLGMQTLHCPLACVMDSQPGSWERGSLALIFSSVKCCYMPPPHQTQCRKALKEGLHVGRELHWDMGLHSSLSLKTFGWPWAFLAWHPPAAWQSGGLSLYSAAANSKKHTFRALCRTRIRAVDVVHERSKYLSQIQSWTLDAEGSTRKKSKKKWNRIAIHARAKTAAQIYSLSVLCLLPNTLD